LKTFKILEVLERNTLEKLGKNKLRIQKFPQNFKPFWNKKPFIGKQKPRNKQF
jgi:hypothetical protein